MNIAGHLKKVRHIYSVLECSTIHIKETTLIELENDFEKMTSSLIIFKKADYGWFIYVPDYEISNVSEDMMRIIQIAKNEDCRFIDLDSDGPEYNDLEKYDW